MTERLDGQTTRIALAGEVDLATVPRLRVALAEVVNGPATPRQIVVDVAELRFIDAGGIGVLLEARNAAQLAGAVFSVRNPTGMVLQVINMLGLAAALDVAPPR